MACYLEQNTNIIPFKCSGTKQFIKKKKLGLKFHHKPINEWQRTYDLPGGWELWFQSAGEGRTVKQKHHEPLPNTPLNSFR